MTATLPQDLAARLGLVAVGDTAEVTVDEVLADGQVVVSTADMGMDEDPMTEAPPELRAALSA